MTQLQVPIRCLKYVAFQFDTSLNTKNIMSRPFLAIFVALFGPKHLALYHPFNLNMIFLCYLHFQFWLYTMCKFLFLHSMWTWLTFAGWNINVFLVPLSIQFLFWFDVGSFVFFFVGIEIYCAPTADSRDLWQASMTHIALEGGCFVLSANQFCRRKDYPPPPEYIFSGTEEELTPDSVVCAGGSVIISPSGTILAGPNYDGEALISADLGMPSVYILSNR